MGATNQGSLRIGFVSTRLAGTDGVSLEVLKWKHVLEGMGHLCFAFAGEIDWKEEDRGMTVPEAHFKHPDVAWINGQLFRDHERSTKTSARIHSMIPKLRDAIAEFVRRFDLDLLIAENAFSLPMNLPLGLALAGHVAQTGIRTIAHHHDFWWERERYAGSPAEDYLRAAFPPVFNSVHHVVINSVAGRNLSYRTGVSASLVPNVMDFANPASVCDNYCETMFENLGLPPDTHLILQPTRIVPRKQIEKALELVRRLDRRATLLITHEAGDEGREYLEYLEKLADILSVEAIFGSDRFDAQRGRLPNGDKIYSLADGYRAAGLVTYCSSIEGFGNAFLEAIYHRRPLIMSAYEIFSRDIQPKGFSVMYFKNFIPDKLVAQAGDILDDPSKAEEDLERNYQIGRRHYSLESLERRLHGILEAVLADM